MDWSLLNFDTVREVYNVHPMFVHFPVALLPCAFLLYLAGVLGKWKSLFIAGRACLYLGIVGACLAVFTGLRAEDSIPHNETIHHMMETHESTAWWVLGAAFLLGAWSFWNREHKPVAPWCFVLVSLAASLLVLLNADLGARMVYLEGAGVKPATGIITGETPRQDPQGRDVEKKGNDAQRQKSAHPMNGNPREDDAH